MLSANRPVNVTNSSQTENHSLAPFPRSDVPQPEHDFPSNNPDPRIHFVIPGAVLDIPQVLSNTPGEIVSNLETRRIRPLIESSDVEMARQHDEANMDGDSVLNANPHGQAIPEGWQRISPPGFNRRAWVPNSSVPVQPGLGLQDYVAREWAAAADHSDAEEGEYEEAWQRFNATLL